MQAGIDLLYERVGRHLAPRIVKDKLFHKSKEYKIREGKCKRTGLTGPVVDYEESQHGVVIVPTLAKIVWMFGTHPLPSKDQITDQRLGGVIPNQMIVLTNDRTISNIRLSGVPNLEAMDMFIIIKTMAQVEFRDYLMISFCRSNNRVFGNELRRSHDFLEVNGDLDIGRNSVSNERIVLDRAREIAASGIDYAKLKEIFKLVSQDERTTAQAARFSKLIEGIPVSLLRVLRHSQWRDLSLARILML